jgi:hypothetical protein
MVADMLQKFIKVVSDLDAQIEALFVQSRRENVSVGGDPSV